MASTLPRARFVTGDPKKPYWLYAFYRKGVRPADLASAVVRLQALAGVGEVHAVDGTVNQSSTPTTVLVVRVQEPLENIEEALRVFREVTNSERPLAVSYMRLDLLICRCGRVSSQHDVRFVLGFGPNDEAAFMRAFNGRLAKLDLGRLLKQHPKEPFPHVRTALIELLSSLGAKATALFVSRVADSGPCTHSR